MGENGAYRINIIIDLSYLYHRHVYGYKDGHRRKIYGAGEDGSTNDITMEYSVLQDIETIRSIWINRCTELVVSLCFDSKTERKNLDSNYKSNRKNKLDQSDFDKLNTIRRIVTELGYNVYKVDRMEADDLITSLVVRYKDDFDFTLIYTVDSDMLVNLSSNVGVMRFKSSLAQKYRGRAIQMAHVPIAVSNFSEVMGKEYECEMPFNTTILYKCTVGDNSDVVKGICGFGIKSYDKLIYKLRESGVTEEAFARMSNPEEVRNVLESLREELGNDKVNEALKALELVRFTDVDVAKPEKRDSRETREAAYSKYDMRSLIW